MATSPITPLPMSLSAMLEAFKRNRAAEQRADIALHDDDAQFFCNQADALGKSIWARVNDLLASEGVTLDDLAGAGL